MDIIVTAIALMDLHYMSVLSDKSKHSILCILPAHMEDYREYIESDCFNRGPTSKKDGEVFQYYPFYWLYGIVMLTLAAINFLIGKELKRHLTNVRKGNKRLFKATLGPSLEILQQLLKHRIEFLNNYFKWLENKSTEGFKEKLDSLEKLETYLSTLVNFLSKSIKNRESSLSVKDKNLKDVKEKFELDFNISEITDNNGGDQYSINKLTTSFRFFFRSLFWQIDYDLRQLYKDEEEIKGLISLRESNLAKAPYTQDKIEKLADAKRLTEDFKLFAPSNKPYSLACASTKIIIMSAIIIWMMVYRIFPFQKDAQFGSIFVDLLATDEVSVLCLVDFKRMKNYEQIAGVLHKFQCAATLHSYMGIRTIILISALSTSCFLSIVLCCAHLIEGCE